MSLHMTTLRAAYLLVVGAMQFLLSRDSTEFIST